MLNRLYSWYGKSIVRVALILIIALTLLGLFLTRDSGEAEAPEPALKTVRVAPAVTLGSEASLVLVGTVESKSQANIQTESAGRVVSVPVALGQRVAAGQVIATLENANERAAVIQAEGAYEAALAGAAQSDVSVRDAETSLDTARTTGVNTYRSAYTTVDDIIRNLVDELFTNPDGGGLIGFRPDSNGQAIALNNERIAYRTVLDDWSRSVTSIVDNTDAATLLAAARADTLRTIAFVDTLADLLADDDNADYSDIDTYKTRFLTARSNLNATLSNLTAAQSGIKNAEEALERAQIAGTNTDVSAANAQVKQALGALLNAQATLAKTIIRTPIAGTLNELSLKTGDFVGTNASVAVVANNGALEITTFVGDNDRAQIAVEQEVTIDTDIIGIITAIAPAVNTETKKVEVKISTESDQIANGDTVIINIAGVSEAADTDRVVLPITAIKFSDVNGVVFTVEDNVLVAHDVVLGTILGSAVEIVAGVATTDEVVIDARGLTAGQRVEAIR